MGQLIHKSASAVQNTDDFELLPPRYKPQRIDVLCRRTNFTKTEVKIIYQGFKQACPSGIVNESTFKEIYSQFFPQGDATQYAHHVFRLLDQGENGTINFEDFLTGLSLLSRGTTLDRLQWTFNLYDLNGDGNITKAEIEEMITAIYNLVGKYAEPVQNEMTPKEHAERVFEKLDLNKDGVVTFDEFIETCLRDENVINSLQLLDTVL